MFLVSVGILRAHKVSILSWYSDIKFGALYLYLGKSTPLNNTFSMNLCFLWIVPGDRATALATEAESLNKFL